MVVYHGTDSDFTVFKKGDVGFHVGTKEQAEHRVRGVINAKIMPLYADIKHPLEIEADYGDWSGNSLANRFLDNGMLEDYPGVEDTLRDILEVDRAKGGKSAAERKNHAVRDLLQSLGFDGIKYLNTFEGDGNSYSYIVFEPSQIKSATDNIGTFNSSNPDIRYSMNSTDWQQFLDDNYQNTGSGQRLKDIREIKNAYENPVITENFTDDDTTHTKIVKRIDYSGNMDFSEENLDRIHEEYLNSTDEDVVFFYTRVNNGEKTKPYQVISPASYQQVKDIKTLTDIDVADSKNVLNRSVAEHIEKRHGVNGKADKTMSDTLDVGRLQYVLDNYDTVELLEKQSIFNNSGNTANAPLVRFSKRVNGTIYVVEAVADSKNNNIWVNSAYKKEAPNRSFNSTNAPQVTSGTFPKNNASGSNIANQSQDVNNNKPISQRTRQEEAA